jgi:hypothetical protein
VPKDARGKYAIRLSFDLGPLAGKLIGKTALEVGN